MKKIAIWIDCDAGVDDIIALMLSGAVQELDIKGISVVGKNNEALNDGFKNVRNVLSLCKRDDIKVYKGTNKPLVHDEISNTRYPTDCLKDFNLSESKNSIETKHAWDAIYEQALKQADGLTIVTLGPLSNIATMIAVHPEVINHINRIVMMGGCINGGNITPCAEYNVYVDPEAAENVFKSSIPVEMFGLDVTLKVQLDDEDIKKINSLDTETGKLFKGLVEKHGKPMYLHDCLPVMYLVKPELFTGYECGIFVETQGTIANGKTCADLYTDYKYDDRHCKAFIDVNKKQFMEYLLEYFK